MGGHLQKVDVHLKRCITQQPEELTFSLYLLRHDVEDDHLQRADVLMLGPVTGYYEYIFFSKRFVCRKFCGYPYWQYISLLSYHMLIYSCNFHSRS